MPTARRFVSPSEARAVAHQAAVFSITNTG